MSAFDDYLQLLNNNPKMDVTKNAFNNWLDTTKNTISNSLPPTNGDPSALIDWAANSTPTGLAGNILAWHGSPHKFTKFENKAIGSGEGAQAFGMGHYSGEHYDVLDSFYRRRLVDEKGYSPLESFISDPRHQEAIGKLRSHIKDNVAPTYPRYDSLNDAQKKVTNLKIYNDTIQSIFNKGQFGRRFDLKGGTTEWPGWSGGIEGNELYNMARAYAPPPPNQGYLYQLNLKPNKEDLLHFNKAISKQDPKIIDSYVNAMKSLGLEQDANTALSSNLKGRDAYNNLIKTTGSSTNTSKLLNDFGIPGHAFAGQGGKGLDNYVMYNPDDIEIIRRISAGLENPRDSFKRYPNTVHRAVNDYNVDSGTIDPKTIDSLLNELSNSGLKKLKFW